MSEDSVILTVDCSGIQGPLSEIENSDAFRDFTEQIFRGLREIGLVNIVNHGVDAALIDDFFARSREFFDLPEDVKGKYRKCDAVENFQGYSHPDDENFHEQDLHNTEDFNESWDTHGLDAFDESKFPEEVPKFKDAFDNLRTRLIDLTKKILKALAIALKLDDPNFFEDKHRHFNDRSVPCHETFRVNHYFPLDPEEEFGEGSMRQSPVSCWGSVLFGLIGKGLDGLEVEKPNGEWIPVPILKDAIFICPGLMMENWSGGVLHGVRHRIRINKDTSNRSFQFGVLYTQPDSDITCTPLNDDHEDWNPKYPKKSHTQTHLEYFRERVAASRKPAKN